MHQLLSQVLAENDQKNSDLTAQSCKKALLVVQTKLKAVLSSWVGLTHCQSSCKNINNQQSPKFNEIQLKPVK